MSKSSTILNAAPVQYTLLVRVFGCFDSQAFRKKFDSSIADLRPPIEKLFLNDAASTAALERACVLEHARSFVTFTNEPRHMKLWELSAHVRSHVDGKSGDIPYVEADLQSIVRNFGACIAIPQLYGKDFLARYPQVLEDLWKFDNDLLPLLMIGIPQWAPFKIMKDGLAAQSRLNKEIGALYRRIHQYQHGEPIDFGADMSDISETALGRSKVYERDGWSFEEQGQADLAVLWGQNANTQPVLFWLLAYIYSTPGLLEQIRDEIAPYVRVSSATPQDSAFLDIPGLSKGCQLLKACVFETYRLVNEPTSIRYLAHAVTVENGNASHNLKAGTFISVPHSTANRNSSIYINPDEFNPGRFLVNDASSGATMARYGRLKPWGMGVGICKGRVFAEKEILVLSAAIISNWDISPTSGTWEFPPMSPGTGIRKPSSDIRVMIKRRM